MLGFPSPGKKSIASGRQSTKSRRNASFLDLNMARKVEEMGDHVKEEREE